VRRVRTILLVPLAFRDLIEFRASELANAATGGLLGALSLNGHFTRLFGLAALWALAVSARFYTVSWLASGSRRDLRNAVYSRVLAQSPQFFETLQTGRCCPADGRHDAIQPVAGSSIFGMGLRRLFQFIGGHGHAPPSTQFPICSPSTWA